MAAAAALALAAACATNPATGRSQLSLVSEQQEIGMGRQADREIVSSIGLYEDERLQRYVAGLGARLAGESERPGLPWTFRVVDDSAVNAFALPGGFIYVTRGLMAHMRSEAQLAGVLGHEIGHVTGRHSVNQISKAQLTTLGLGIGMILRPELQDFGGLAEMGLSLLFLKYGRDHEREADLLGVRYMTREGYEPGELRDVFRTLERVGDAAGSRRLPGWLSTHPSAEDRTEHIAAAISELPPGRVGGRVEQDGYLRRLDGVEFGEDPREGYFEGNDFYHPEMRFRLEFPAGWTTANRKEAVGATSPGRDAVVVVTLSRQGAPAAAAREFASQQGVRLGTAQRGQAGGLASLEYEFAAATGQGEVRGVAAFVEHGGRVFQILGYTPAASWSRYDGVLRESVDSFRRLDDSRYLNVEPKRLDVVALPGRMSLREANERYPSTEPLETVAILNQAEEGDHFPAGALFKRVVGGRRAGGR